MFPGVPGQRNHESRTLWFLASFALAGLVYLQFVCSGKIFAGLPEKPLYTAAISPNSLAETLTAAPVAEPFRGHLFMPDDQLEAKQAATFVLEDASSSSVNYAIELPDGKQLKFQNGKVSHTFSEFGDITVKLFGTFNGVTKELDQRTFQVARPMNDVAKLYHLCLDM